MNTEVDNYFTERRLPLNQVIAIYSDAHTVYAQIHRLSIQKGKPVLLEGKPVNKNGIRKLCASFLPRLAPEIEFIHERVVAKGSFKGGPVLWWSPTAKKPIYFAKETGIKSGNAYWPNLLFLKSSTGKLYVFALKESERPHKDTHIYIAPFPNVSLDEGKVCLGDVSVEKYSGIDVWERAFFESRFTDEYIDDDKVIKPWSLQKLWQRQVESGKRFPGRLLIRHETITVGQLIKSIKGGQIE